MFRGFKVAVGKDRFDQPIEISGEPAACKASAQDTHGAMCVFELTAATTAAPATFSRHRGARRTS
jgi:hypothetical protein